MINLYALKSSNLNNCSGVKQKQVTSQKNFGPKLSFKGNYDNIIKSFLNSSPKEQENILNGLLEGADRENRNVLNGVMNCLNIKNPEPIDWNKNINILDLRKHTAEEYTSSLLNHLISNMGGKNIRHVIDIRGNRYAFPVGNLEIDFSSSKSSTDTLWVEDTEKFSFLRTRFFKLQHDNGKGTLQFKQLDNIIDIDKKVIELYQEFKAKIIKNAIE